MDNSQKLNIELKKHDIEYYIFMILFVQKFLKNQEN